MNSSVTEREIRQQLPNVLAATDLRFLGSRYQGKVRDSYSSSGTRFLITTDRLSCFDVVVTTVPFKGQVLNQMAVHWFALSRDVIDNHLIDVPDPNVMVAKECEILPIEIVVRGYLAGSAWRDYQAGKPVSGIILPPGLRQNEKLPEPILTPSTKAASGSHDVPISEREILASGLVSEQVWGGAREIALQLFELGRREADRRGLILVDTKYELGLRAGKLLLADEIHTLDSSRYWVKASYPDRFAKGEAPEMLDKEPTRQWLLAQGYKGDGPIPEFTDDHRVSIARHYLDAFGRITGKALDAGVEPVAARIERRLRGYQIPKPA